MNEVMFLLLGIGMVFMLADKANALHDCDLIETSAGDLSLTFIGHGSLMFEFNGLFIQIDPFNRVADYSLFPKADLILITHDHPDHLDLQAIDKIRRPDTILVLTEACARQIEGGSVMKNGEAQSIRGIHIEAVAAYNQVHKRPDGQPFHPKGVGNGYLLTFGDKRIYVAGDTEHIPEMSTLGPVYCAFLPMNLPYTMTPGMTAAAAKTIRPQILYPYHYSETDTGELVGLLKEHPEIEVRIRNLQ